MRVPAWNGAPGTRIEVRHLFFNTPVRRKFMRTAATEMGHVSEVFTRLALAKQAAANRPAPDAAGTTTRWSTKCRLGRAAGPHRPVLRRRGRRQLYAVDAQQGPGDADGYIADPACERGNARMQYLFLNGRWIRDRSLGHALQEAIAAC